MDRDTLLCLGFDITSKFQPNIHGITDDIQDRMLSLILKVRWISRLKIIKLLESTHV